MLQWISKCHPTLDLLYQLLSSLGPALPTSEFPGILPELCLCQRDSGENRACPLPLPALMPRASPGKGCIQTQAASCVQAPGFFNHHMLLSLRLDLLEILASNRTPILFSVQPPARSYVPWGSRSHPALRQTLISPSQTYNAMVKNEQGAAASPKQPEGSLQRASK